MIVRVDGDEALTQPQQIVAVEVKLTVALLYLLEKLSQLPSVHYQALDYIHEELINIFR